MTRTRVTLAVASLLAATAVAGAPPALAAPSAADPAASRSHAACSTPAPGRYRCLSYWQPGAGVSRARASTVARLPVPDAGYGPADIASAYRLLGTGTGGSGMTVAVVDAYDNPRAEADLARYRATFGLPPCTTANGCFRKVNQRGRSAPPPGDPGWGVEIALDIQAVSATCPQCRILLVEADDPYLDNMGKAVNTAVRLGADVVSNSYGAGESTSMVRAARDYYTHPGVAQVAASGDYGFQPASFPASLPRVVAVGGTTLAPNATGGWKERAWSGSGSGCSAWFGKPLWQTDANCDMRTTSDVSAVADPETGLAVYDTYGLGSSNGWIVVGGTSLSAPLIAGMIARAGNPAELDRARYIYQHPAGLRDITRGSNGFCGGDYLCTSKPGYDAPTGMGSPRGLSAL